MSNFELPLINEDTSIEDAFNHLVNTGESAVVVKTSDGARVFPAQYLHLQLVGQGSKPLREAGGGLRIPQADAETILKEHLDIALLRATANRATISAFSDHGRGMFLALNTYRCDGPPKHKYFSWELSTLTPAGPNKWECMKCTPPPKRYVT
jgi:hypothetical protein